MTSSPSAFALATSVAIMAVGCGSQPPTKTTTSTSTPEAGTQRQAEAIFEREGLDYYIGILRPSTVRFTSTCSPAKEGGKGWTCAGWGLIVIESGEGKPGECEFVEGNVTASGLVGKPSGTPMTFSGSPCELDFGLGHSGKRPSSQLVAAWTRKQQVEVQRLKEWEASPEAQQQKREEDEEKQRAEEASRAEHGE